MTYQFPNQVPRPRREMPGSWSCEHCDLAKQVHVAILYVAPGEHRYSPVAPYFDDIDAMDAWDHEMRYLEELSAFDGDYREQPDALFDVALPEHVKPKLTAGEQKNQRGQRLLDQGLHPLTKRPLLREEGHTCGDCIQLTRTGGYAKSYPKCKLVAGHGYGTDVKLSWPACNLYSERPPEPKPKKRTRRKPSGPPPDLTRKAK